MDVAQLLDGMSGNQLAQMSDFELDELGVPARMRAYLRDKLLAPPSAPPVDEQVAAAGAWPAHFYARNARGSRKRALRVRAF